MARYNFSAYISLPLQRPKCRHVRATSGRAGQAAFGARRAFLEHPAAGAAEGAQHKAPAAQHAEEQLQVRRLAHRRHFEGSYQLHV